MLFVKNIDEIKNNSIVLSFSNWEKREIDFDFLIKDWFGSEELPEESQYKQILNSDYFKTVKLNTEFHTIEWDNWLDFCPDSLYQWWKSV